MHALAAADSAEQARAALARSPDRASSLGPLLTEAAHRLVHEMLSLADHDEPAPPEAWASVFDRAAALSPEAGVALYSLGDRDRLAEATAEVVGWLRGEGLLGPDRRLLEIGCGIGRFLAALAGEVALAAGLDVSGAMCAEAARRLRGRTGTGVIRTGGRDLRAFADGAFDLVLAVDSFPYLVNAGLQARTLAEAARVLAPDGEAVVLNWSYRGDPDEDLREAEEAAQACGLRLAGAGAPGLRHWDGVVFRFRPEPC